MRQQVGSIHLLIRATVPAPRHTSITHTASLPLASAPRFSPPIPALALLLNRSKRLPKRLLPAIHSQAPYILFGFTNHSASNCTERLPHWLASRADHVTSDTHYPRSMSTPNDPRHVLQALHTLHPRVLQKTSTTP